MFGNNVVFLGRLTHDIELKTAGDTVVTNFTLARNRPKVKDKEQESDFVRFVAFGKMAETIEKYVKKGERLGVSGRLQVRSYEDKDGNKRTATEVIVETIEFIETKSTKSDNSETSNTNSASKSYEAVQDEAITPDDEEYPF